MIIQLVGKRAIPMSLATAKALVMLRVGLPDIPESHVIGRDLVTYDVDRVGIRMSLVMDKATMMSSPSLERIFPSGSFIKDVL